MDDGMLYDPIQGQGQGQGHGASELPKIALFQVYLLRYLQWELASDHLSQTRAQYLHLFGPDFFTFILVFVSRDLEFGGVPAVSPSTQTFFRFQ